jgi:hypothetical protein
MRTPSAKSARNGGYIHRFGDLFNSAQAPAKPPAPPAPSHMPSDKVAAVWTRWGIQTADHQVQPLAQSLGVSLLSLRQIGIAWAWPYDAWAFPMFDGNGEFRGIRLRYDTGEKRAVSGSRQGIFIPDTDIPAEEICICEGPTDTAAMLSLGMFAIGRPSCTGGGPEITAFCRKNGIKRITIIADNDGPGRAGAEKLANTHPMRARIATLPAKDVREFVRLGGTRETIETCINNAVWRG